MPRHNEEIHVITLDDPASVVSSRLARAAATASSTNIFQSPSIVRLIGGEYAVESGGSAVFDPWSLMLRIEPRDKGCLVRVRWSESGTRAFMAVVIFAWALVTFLLSAAPLLVTVSMSFVTALLFGVPFVIWRSLHAITRDPVKVQATLSWIESVASGRAG